MASTVWGILGYAVATLATIVGLSIKMISLMKQKSKLERQNDSYKRDVKDLQEEVKLVAKDRDRHHKAMEVLREELDKVDGNLDPDTVANRLDSLLQDEI